MKLLIVLITFNRWAYTHRTLKYLWATAPEPSDYHLLVVDNNSTDETQKELKKLLKRSRIDGLILNPDNYYPGKACNIGWQEGLLVFPDATHLMRLDNDMVLEPGWPQAVEAAFKNVPELGQLGIEHEAIECEEAELRRYVINGIKLNTFPGAVGGPNIIRRKIWDDGLRYDEDPWHSDQAHIPQMQEDSKFSRRIIDAGWVVAHLQDNYGHTFANKNNWNEYPDYYRKTMSERGYQFLAEQIKEKLQ